MHAPVNAHNEWDPLEEVIIGRIDGAQIPRPGTDLFAIEYADHGSPDQIPSGPLPQQVVDETETELEALCDTLRDLGVKVRRPESTDHAAIFGTTDWQTDGFYNYCPRDVLLAIGDLVIETPMALRSRFLEPFAYKDLLLEYFDGGARWISAPKPRLRDASFDAQAPAGRRLGEQEPIFDAANILKFNSDILYLVSDSGNALGAQWLQRALGDAYRVHEARDLYASTHVDSTVVPVKEGTVLLNPERVNDRNMPDFLRDWEVIWAPEMIDTGFVGERPYCSTWIGMNLLVVRPGVVLADDRQLPLIRTLESHGVEVIPQRLTHSRSLGGSFHCVSLDIRRGAPQ